MPSAASTSDRTSFRATPALRAAILLSGLYFLSRFVGLFQSLLISALLPAAQADAYNLAFDLPDYLNYLVAGGALSLTFIPTFTRYWEKGREAEAWRFFSTVASVLGVALVVLTALAMILAPQFIALTKQIEDPKKFDLTVQMTRILLPAQLFFYLGGLLVGVLNAFKRFGATGWTGVVYNLVALALAVPLYLATKNPLVFAWGILVGAFVGNFLLPLLAAQSGPRAQRPRFTFRFRPDDAVVRRFFLLTIPIMLGISLPTVDQWVVNYFASGLGDGPTTHLKNANRLMIAAQGMVGQAAAVAAFPFLAAQVAGQNFRELAEFMRTGLRRLLFLTFPLAALLILWSGPLTRIIFGWGEMSDPTRLHETAVGFAFYTIALFAWAGQAFVARGFYALGDTWTPNLIGSILTIVLLLPLCWLLSGAWGAAGLALAVSVGVSVHFFAVLFALDRVLRQQRYRAPIRLEKIFGTLMRTGLATLFMLAAGGLALKLAAPIIAHDKIGDLGLMAWTGAVALFTFVAAASRFEIPEWTWLRAKVERRKRGTALAESPKQEVSPT